MKEVERRLAETDSGSWTQEEQERIVKALELEGKSIDALKKLIEEIEQNQSGGGGGGGKGKPKPGGQDKGGQPQKQGGERQQDQGERPVNPQGEKPGEQPKDKDGRPMRPDKSKQQERNDQQAENDKKSEKPMPPAGETGAPGARQGQSAGESWGSLPPKQAREVIDAKRREPPQQWRKQIEDYFRKLAETKK